MRFEDESDEVEEEGMENVERGYRGIHLSFPLKRADLELLIETFRKRKVNCVVQLFSVNIINIHIIYNNIINIHRCKLRWLHFLQCFGLEFFQ